MCRVLYSSLEFTVELSLSFCFVPEAMKNRLMRLPPGFCWNHCRVLTVEEKLHLRVQLAPSCRFRTEGLCSTFTALTPAWEEKNKHIWCLRRVMDAVSRPETISGNTHEDVGPYRSSRSAHLPSFPSCTLGQPRLTAKLDPQKPQQSFPPPLHDSLLSYWGTSAPTLEGVESWVQRSSLLTVKMFQFYWNSPVLLRTSHIWTVIHLTGSSTHSHPGRLCSNLSKTVVANNAEG